MINKIGEATFQLKKIKLQIFAFTLYVFRVFCQVQPQKSYINEMENDTEKKETKQKLRKTSLIYPKFQQNRL